MSNVAVEKIEEGALVTQPICARILLVDEEESIQSTLSTILLREGYSVYQARSGKEAVERVHSTRPDLILLEVGLPDMEGKDVIRRLRGWAVAPIIVISAHNEVSEKVTSLDSGAHDYLTKPFSTPELLARMRVLPCAIAQPALLGFRVSTCRALLSASVPPGRGRPRPSRSTNMLKRNPIDQNRSLIHPHAPTSRAHPGPCGDLRHAQCRCNGAALASDVG